MPISTSSFNGIRTERRIAWLILLFGVIAAATVAVLHHATFAAGILIGSVLSWLNFRWLRHGLDALVSQAAAQEGAGKPQVSLGVWFRLVFRYGLLGICMYVIFVYLRISLVSMMVGLCALGGATLTATVFEIVSPMETPDRAETSDKTESI